MNDPYANAVSRFGLMQTGADPDQFFPDPSAGATGYFDRPSAGFNTPQGDNLGDQLHQYVMTGVFPTQAPAQAPAQPQTQGAGDFTDDDWKLINSTSNPAGTIKMINGLRKQSDLENGIKEISALDWSNPTKAMQDLQGVYARRPSAGKELQSYGAGAYRMLGQQKPVKPDSHMLPGDSPEFLQKLYDIDPLSDTYRADMSKLLKENPEAYRDTRILQHVTEQHRANTSYRSSLERADNTQEARQAAADAKANAPKDMNSAQSKLYMAAQDSLKNAMTTSVPGKRAAYRAAFGRDPATDEEWNKAYHLAADDKIAKAQEHLNTLRESFGPRVQIPGAPVTASPTNPVAPTAGKTIPNVAPAVQQYLIPKK